MEDLKIANYYSSRTLKQRVKELFGRELTDAQIVTGLRSGALPAGRVGNARVYPRKEAEAWIALHMRRSTSNPQAVRVSTKRLPKDKREDPATLLNELEVVEKGG